MQDNGATRDVSDCERLILVVQYLYHHYENGDLQKNPAIIRWDDIDRLKQACDVLPSDYQAMLEVIETYR